MYKREAAKRNYIIRENISNFRRISFREKIAAANEKFRLEIPQRVEGQSIIELRRSQEAEKQQQNEANQNLISMAKMMRMNLNIIRPAYNNDSWNEALQEAARAVMDNKIFSIFGVCPGLREELNRRGWVEKLYPQQLSKRSSNTNHLKRVMLSEILKYISPDFLWSGSRYSANDFKPGAFYNKINRVDPSDFTSKNNLGRICDNIYWFNDEEYNAFICPRSHVLLDSNDKDAFREDFRLTLCTSFLYHLSQMKNTNDIFCLNGKYKTDCLDFALNYVRTAISRRQHQDIDRYAHDNEAYSPYYFENMQTIFADIMRKSGKIEPQGTDTMDRYWIDIMSTVHELKTVFPHTQYDGSHNLWIVKASASHCGAQIKLMQNETEIVSYIEKNRFRTYVVQKYIEKPLLIHKTKFDIRQYFLIAMDDDYFNVWFYNDCYFKLSGRDYNLNNLCEQIHITNHTVQKKYQPEKTRASELPKHNMMVLDEFKEYLKHIEKENVWYGRILPGMINCIRSIAKYSFDDLTVVKNNFELYGADFMISDDFYPILIEVNAVPDLRHSTVSSKKVNQSLVADLVKVIVDLPDNSHCDTGKFENIWKFRIPKDIVQNYSLKVEGRAIRRVAAEPPRRLTKFTHPPASTHRGLINVTEMPPNNRNSSLLIASSLNKRSSGQIACSIEHSRVSKMLDSAVKVLNLSRR